MSIFGGRRFRANMPWQDMPAPRLSTCFTRTLTRRGVEVLLRASTMPLLARHPRFDCGADPGCFRQCSMYETRCNGVCLRKNERDSQRIHGADCPPEMRLNFRFEMKVR